MQLAGRLCLSANDAVTGNGFRVVGFAKRRVPAAQLVHAPHDRIPHRML